jgi:chemotaxis protein methyltransferase CheR
MSLKQFVETSVSMMDFEELTTKQFDLFRDFIYRHSGIRMDVNKITLATNRIRRRMKANQLEDFDAYYALLTSRDTGGAELECLLDAVTTNETSFFRTNSHFEWFKEEFLSEIANRELRGERSKQLRIWSAACSTGEEPYSLAMCLQESMLKFRDWKLSILGTDISESVLRDAKAAVYKRKTVEELSDQRVKRHFEATPDGQLYSLRPSVRELVQFRRHNLMNTLHLMQFDCIFIRNVLIYFDRESKATVIKHLIQSLARGGYLVVGPSEGIYDMLEPLEKRQTFLYQKPY